MRTRCLGVFSVMWVTKFLISLVKIWLKICVFVHFGPGLAGSFGALLVGWSVVVARGLYLARHLFTLYLIVFSQSLYVAQLEPELLLQPDRRHLPGKVEASNPGDIWEHLRGSKLYQRVVWTDEAGLPGWDG